MRKKLFIGFISLAVVVGLLLIVLPQKSKKDYQFTKVTRKNLVQTVTASGKIKAAQSVELKFQTSGLLSWVGVKKGDYVHKGQGIAQLDKKELQKTLEKYLKDYASQRNDFEEMFRVTYREQTPQAALTDTVKRILEKNQYDLDKAVLDVELKDYALKLATLISPIDGVLTQIDTPIAGINITPATAVFTIANPEAMIFEAEIDEIDIGQIKDGQKANIILDAYPQETISGLIKKVSFESIATKGGGTAFVIEIDLPPNEGQKYKIGMNGEVEIVIAQKEAALTIPLETLSWKGDQPQITLLVKGKPQLQPVKIGLQSETEVEIIEGLDENQEIVSD